MEKCECYHITEEARYLTEFEQGVRFATTGKRISKEIIKVARCWGTKECDECICGGDQTKCDFYADVRKEAAEKEKSEPKFGEWISVRRQEPPTNKEILVRTNKGKIFTYSLGIGEGFGDVTHWMPLPEPPKK